MERFLFMFTVAVVALAVTVPAQASVMYTSGLTEVAHGEAVNGANDTNYASLASGSLIGYAGTGSELNGAYGPYRLDDGDFGVSGLCYITATDTTGSILLTFDGGAAVVGEIEIHMGYIGRDDGTYTIKDDQGTVRGVFSISTAANGDREDTDNIEPDVGGVDYFLAEFDSAFETTSLTIEYSATDPNGSGTVSFCEIQVFEGIPEPATLSLVVAGGAMTLLRKRRK